MSALCARELAGTIPGGGRFTSAGRAGHTGIFSHDPSPKSDASPRTDRHAILVPKSGRILCLSIRERRRFQLSSAVSLRTGKRSLLVAHEESLKRLMSMDFLKR